MLDGTTSLFAGAVVLGLVHGAEPGHGWPVAAAYALDRSRRWVWGLVAALVIGVGHLVSSVAVVAAFLLAASYLDVASLDWLKPVAGVLLVLLGLREYRHGGHGHHDDHAPRSPDDHDGPELFATTGDAPPTTSVLPEGAGDREGDRTLLGRARDALPSVGGGGHHGHSHGHPDHDSGLTADEGLSGLAGAAFVLGFAHEEEVEILGFCTGATQHCLALMLAYALSVVVALVVLTLLLVAGYERYEERVARYADYFPAVSAVVLVAVGLGFVVGVL